MINYFREQIAVGVMNYVGAFVTLDLMGTPFYETVQNLNSNVNFLFFMFSVISFIKICIYIKKQMYYRAVYSSGYRADN